MSTGKEQNGIIGAMKANIRSYIMVIALVVLWIIFSALTKGVFIMPRNLSNLFRQMSTTGIISVGMTLVIICGYMDL